MLQQFNNTKTVLPYSVINQYAIGLDAFSIQLAAPDRDRDSNKQHLLNISITDCLPEYQQNGFTLKKEVSNHPAFHIQFGVYSLKQRLATLYSHPTKGYGYSKHLRPLHVENSALYTLDFARLIPAFLKAFDFKLNNISRLDIDIDNQQRNPAELIKTLVIQDSDNYQRLKHKNDSGLQEHGTISENNVNKPYTMYIGNDNKKVQSKIYNKTAENDKPYITSWHKANGLTADAPIYRFEISLKTNAFASYKPYAVTEDGEAITLHQLNNSEFSKTTKAVKVTDKTKLNIDISQLNNKAYLVSLFEKFINIDIRRKDATRISRCSKVPLFDFGIYGKEELVTTVTQSINMSEKIKEKKYIKESLERFKATGSMSYLEIARETAERNDLFTDMAILIKSVGIEVSAKTFGIDLLLENYETLRELNVAA